MTFKKPTKMRIWWKRDKATEVADAVRYSRDQVYYFKLEVDNPAKAPVIWQNSYHYINTTDRRNNTYTKSALTSDAPEIENNQQYNIYFDSYKIDYTEYSTTITFMATYLDAQASLTIPARGDLAETFTATDWAAGDWVEIGGGKILTLSSLRGGGAPLCAAA